MGKTRNADVARQTKARDRACRRCWIAKDLCAHHVVALADDGADDDWLETPSAAFIHLVFSSGAAEERTVADLRQEYQACRATMLAKSLGYSVERLGSGVVFMPMDNTGG